MRAALLCLALLTACSSYDDLPLLEVDAIEPSEIEPGGTLRIHGRGFPLGHAPEIVLRGSVYRPGQSRVKAEVRLTGIVESDSLVEVPVDDALIEALGGRATMDGELRIGFRTADGRRDVFASERARVDFLPDTPTQLLAQSIREERTSTEPLAAEGFGVELSREELGTVGVRVVSVAPGSLAAKQGLEPGDVVMGLDGVRIYGWRDFVPDPSKSESKVFVARDGLRGVHALRWPHEASESPLDRVALSLFVLLGLALGWVSPAALGIRARLSRVAPSMWITRLSLTLMLAALLLTVSSLQWATMWIVVLGVFAALFTLATKDRAGAASFALTMVSTLTVMLLARTASIAEIVAAQSPAALRWYLFQSPASFLAFGVMLHAIGTVCAKARLSGALYAAASAVLAATLFLGGMPLDDMARGIAILAAKAAAVLVAAHAFEMRIKTAVTLSALGLLLALLSFFVPLEPLFPAWSALAVGCVTALGVRAIVPPLRRVSAPVPV
ncbi:MAG TPA: PDZ domain-containing protein [Polyangiales bacterium]|nr:PDZ domain-containing protein [Polyangiales bacterium]